MKLIYESEIDKNLVDKFKIEGIFNITETDHGYCGLMKFAFTYGIIVGINSTGYERRYCYPSFETAMVGYAKWLLTQEYDPQDSDWIKRKGAIREISNPNNPTVVPDFSGYIPLGGPGHDVVRIDSFDYRLTKLEDHEESIIVVFMVDENLHLGSLVDNRGEVHLIRSLTDKLLPLNKYDPKNTWKVIETSNPKISLINQISNSNE